MLYWPHSSELSTTTHDRFQLHKWTSPKPPTTLGPLLTRSRLSRHKVYWRCRSSLSWSTSYSIIFIVPSSWELFRKLSRITWFFNHFIQLLPRFQSDNSNLLEFFLPVNACGILSKSSFNGNKLSKFILLPAPAFHILPSNFFIARLWKRFIRSRICSSYIFINECIYSHLYVTSNLLSTCCIVNNIPHKTSLPR